ncbi:Calponin-3 [Coelomomyces lativittatus]|nr:Calponin-3 [Coelomomyces lativittatus]
MAQENTVEMAKDWLEKVIGEPIPALDQPTLKDGEILIKLINKLISTPIKFQKSNLPFKQMENINNFLKEAAKLGCPQFELFQTIDLFENKNFNQVLLTIFSISRQAQKLGLNVPSLGPKLAEKRNVQFSEEQLNAGKNIPSQHTSGYTGGANQSGMSIGGFRDVTYKTN